jgi:hypothetical protein
MLLYQTTVAAGLDTAMEEGNVTTGIQSSTIDHILVWCNLH